MSREPTASFISEAIQPVSGTVNTVAMACGEPGLPEEFIWRGTPLVVRKQICRWKDTGACRHGSKENYVRKHWFEVETSEGQVAWIYFERQQRGKSRMQRWWLYKMAQKEKLVQP